MIDLLLDVKNMNDDYYDKRRDMGWTLCFLKCYEFLYN